MRFTMRVFAVTIGCAIAFEASPTLRRVVRDQKNLIKEKAAVDWLERYEVAELPSSRTSFVRTSAKSPIPVVCVHGFDSSALEFRRLLSALEYRGIEAYGLDVVGWGFTEGSQGISVADKRRQLDEFVAYLGLRQYALVGASLGGAVAIDYALSTQGAKPRLGLVAPQCLTDGTPDVPRPLARIGVKILASWPLRSFANQLAYFDKGLATDDAIRIGKLHVERPGWEDDQIDWLLGDGYAVSNKLADLDVERIACFWGQDDGILPPKDAVPVLKQRMPLTATFKEYANCGHVPHLEKPADLADDIVGRLLARTPQPLIASTSAISARDETDISRTQ